MMNIYRDRVERWCEGPSMVAGRRMVVGEGGVQIREEREMVRERNKDGK